MAKARQGGGKVKYPKIPFSNREKVACKASAVKVLYVIKNLCSIDLALAKTLTHVEELEKATPTLRAASPEVLSGMAMRQSGNTMFDRSGQGHPGQLGKYGVSMAKVSKNGAMPNQMFKGLEMRATLTLAINMLPYLKQ